MINKYKDINIYYRVNCNYVFDSIYPITYHNAIIHSYNTELVPINFPIVSLLGVYLNSKKLQIELIKYIQ